MMFMGNKTRLAHRILFPLEVAVAAVLAGWRMTGHGDTIGDCSRHSAIIILTMPISVEALLSTPLVRHLVILNMTLILGGWGKRKV